MPRAAKKPICLLDFGSFIKKRTKATAASG